MDADTKMKIDQILANTKVLDDVKEDVAKIKTDINEFTSIINKTNQKVDDLAAKVTAQQVIIDNLEKTTKMKNLIITGIEEKENNTQQLLMTVTHIISTKLQINSNESDVDTILRVGQKYNEFRPILIVFTSKTLRDRIYSKRTLLKGTNIYMNEHMTTQARIKHKELMDQRRKAKAEGKSVKIVNNKLVEINNEIQNAKRKSVASDDSPTKPLQITKLPKRNDGPKNHQHTNAALLGAHSPFLEATD